MSHLVKASGKQNNQAKRLRICSPSSINRNLIVNISDTQTVEKQTDDKNPVDKSENSNSDSPSSCSGGESPSLPSREKEEFSNLGISGGPVVTMCLKIRRTKLRRSLRLWL